jgi:hypothetical protein
MAGSPEELANHLSFFVIDLTDPEFHHFALKQARSAQASMKGLLDEAVKAGEIGPCDTDGLARVVQGTIQGALLAWAIYREGSAGYWLRRDLDTLIRPYLAGTRHPSARSTRALKAKDGRKPSGKSSSGSR